jgi:hypothetical protein
MRFGFRSRTRPSEAGTTTKAGRHEPQVNHFTCIRYLVSYRECVRRGLGGYMSAAIARVFVRLSSSNEVETLKMLVAFSLASLVLSLLAIRYGADVGGLLSE